MPFRYGDWMLTAINKWDQLDGIGSPYEAEEHIRPKYESRLSVVSRICDALEDLAIISICGNGATSVTKKLAKLVERRRSFPRIAMETVSQHPNLEKIRKSILQQIGRGKINDCLLILDGFWWELKNIDFQTIGIPSPSPRFRIVFTSRSEEMCEKIGSHQIHHVDFLEDEEAWDLFREIAGKPFADLNLHETAKKIVDECDGFRIAILTIASTLKDKPAKVWMDSLKSLKNANGRLKSDMEKVFSRIELCYNLLDDKEAQLMFLICCLFPEDFNIPVEDLILFGKGLQLFKSVNNMKQTRDRVELIVQKLKNSFFLVDGDEDDCVKVHHNMLRDFGVSVSSKWKHTYVVRSENSVKEWPLDGTKCQNYSAISLRCKKIKKHPVNLKCPNLHLLQLSYGSDSAQLPNGILQGLTNLKVLSLSIPSLSQSLAVLKKLRTLCINESISESRYNTIRPRIGDLIGDKMTDLEIFSFSTVRPYRDFPREMGQLRNLRILRFNLERLKYIPPGVLSKLAKLEELYLPQSFISWGCREEGGERMNASLSEIESLQLTALGIGIAKGSILAEKLVKNLTRFRMFIGSHVSPDYEFGSGGNSKKLLEVFDVDADDFGVSWISDLVWKSESLRLKQVSNLNSIFAWTLQLTKERIPQWKKICISDCKELEHIAAGRIPWTSFSQLESLKLFGLCNMKQLWPGLCLSKIEGSCFGNLAEIQIMFCRKLKYVFSVSVAAELKKLQSLQICFCNEIEAIFCREQMNNDGDQVATSSKEGGNESKGKAQLRDPTMSTSIHLKSKLLSITSNSVTKRLFGRGKQPNAVTRDNQTKENVGNKNQQDIAKDRIIFSQLKVMEFAYLDKLQIFCDGNYSILLPSLQSLSIFQCNRMEAFSHGLLEAPLLGQILINGNRYPVTEDINAIVKNWRPTIDLG